MYLAKRTEQNEHRLVESLMLEIGQLFQEQDDYLDCYGDPEVIGKIGTDIRDGKCSWLIVTALTLATPAQRDMLSQHYGKCSDDSEKIVKAIYDQLGLKGIFENYQNEKFDSIKERIQQLDKLNVPVEMFNMSLSYIYKRNK